MVQFTDLGTPKGLAALDKHLQDKSYIEGYTPSQSDVETFNAITSTPDASKTPYVSRWWNHIHFFTPEERKGWGATHAQPAKKEETSTPASAGAPKAAEPAKKDEDFDLFADDDKYDEEYEAEVERRAQEALAKKASSGKAVALKSAVVIDVKPWEADTDMKAMEDGVRGISMEGLEWKASKLVDVAYGVKKLSICCHIVDNIVSVDDIQEQIQEKMPDLVQSTDVASFTKL